MTTGTKIFLAVFALLVALLVTYYGVLGPGGDPALPVDDTTAANQPAVTPPPSVARTGEPKRLRPERSAPEPAPVESELPASAQPEKTAAEPTVASAAADPARVALEQLERDIARAAGTSPGEAAANEARKPAPPAAGLAKGDDLPPSRNARTPETESVPRPQYTDYVIRRGDTMTSIAEAWFGDPMYWDLIARANPFVDPHAMKIGSTLRLPPKDARRSGPAVPLGKPGGVHVVRPGDSLSEIAAARLGDASRWREIFEMNRALIGDDPNRLEVGMQLSIPPSVGRTTRVTNASGGS